MSTAPNSNNIFIHAISQRCGHNFLSGLIKKQSKYIVFIHNSYEVIFPAYLSSKYEDLKFSKNFTRNKKAKLKEIELAAESFINQDKSIIFKTSRFTSSYDVDLFPGIKHIILVRHPLDLFVSYEKSIYNFRIPSLKNRLKKFIRPLYSYYILKIWRRQINEALDAIEKSKHPVN